MPEWRPALANHNQMGPRGRFRHAGETKSTRKWPTKESLSHYYCCTRLGFYGRGKVIIVLLLYFTRFCFMAAALLLIPSCCMIASAASEGFHRTAPARSEATCCNVHSSRVSHHIMPKFEIYVIRCLSTGQRRHCGDNVWYGNGTK